MKLAPVAGILTSLAAAALIGLLIYGVAKQAPNRTLDEAVARGERPKAPDATQALPSLSGAGNSSIAAYKGKVVLLDFWASWCVDCQQEAHRLERLQHRLEGHRATILGITYHDVSSDSQRFVHEYGLTFPNLRDANGELVSAFGTRQLPESFLIDREGRIADIERGPISNSFEKHAIALAEEA